MTYVHPFAWAALAGLCGEWAVVNCEFGLHTVVECYFLMRVDRIHITGTRAECVAYVASDMKNPAGTLRSYLRSIG